MEGADLAVRDNRVYLKTLTGLDPVDIIVRRLDDVFCDPIEFRGDSLLGVPGLVQAVRSGSVVIDNALGSGVLEAPGFLAFFLESAVICWGRSCGCRRSPPGGAARKDARSYALEHLDELVIRPSFPRSHRQTETPAAMDAAKREELIGRIQAQPERFVAQEQVALSTVPVYTESGLETRHVVLRAFAAWDGSSYTVLPGGLTRVSRRGLGGRVPLHDGGGHQGTWVPGGSGEDSAPPVSPPRSGRRELIPAGRIFPAGLRTIFSGWAATPSGSKIGCALVRALCPRSPAKRISDAPHRSSRGPAYCRAEVSAAGSFHATLGEQLWQVQRLLPKMVRDEEPAHERLGWTLKRIRRVALNLKERLSADTWRVFRAD